MEDQEILKLETGTKESISLEPKTVKIEKVSIEIVGEKGNKKASFEVKHPDKEETIRISSVKYESKKALEVSGTWVNLDEDKKLRKGSALSNFLAFLKVATIEEAVGKEVSTVEDEKGYLCFKAY